MNALDIFIIAVVAVAAIMGFVKGLMSQVGQIAAVIFGIIAARLFGSVLTGLLAGEAEPSLLETVAGYGIVFIVVYLLTWLVARMVRGVVTAARLGIVDRLGGAIFKATQWALIMSLMLNFYLLVTGDDETFRDPKSPWRQATVDFAPAVLGYLSDLTANNS